MLRCAPDLQFHTLLTECSAAEIEQEPMLYRASSEFAWNEGGDMTRRFLGLLPDDVRASANIDSRTHMLMRGWYPAIPGWHHDDVRRRGERGQPDYDDPGYLSHHCAMVVDAVDQPTGSLTEFLLDPIDVPWPLPDGVNVYAAWDAYINTLAMRTRIQAAKSGSLIYFDGRTFHRAVPARSTGWRFFIRATWDTPDKPINKIRRNANVYLPSVSAGW